MYTCQMVKVKVAVRVRDRTQNRAAAFSNEQTKLSKCRARLGAIATRPYLRQVVLKAMLLPKAIAFTRIFQVL